MSIVLDVLLIGIVLAFAVFSARKGFAKTFIEFVGFILAVFVSLTISNTLADFCYDKVVRPAVEKRIVSVAEGAVDSSSAAIANQVFEKLPSIVKKSLSSNDVSEDTVTDQLTQTVEENADFEVFASKVCESTVKPILHPLIKLVCQIVLLVILSVAVRLLASLINKLFSIKFLSRFNTSLGLILGVFKGVIAALTFVIIVNAVVDVSPNGLLGISADTIQSTYVFKFILGFIK